MEEVEEQVIKMASAEASQGRRTVEGQTDLGEEVDPMAGLALWCLWWSLKSAHEQKGTPTSSKEESQRFGSRIRSH
jgi:hypothetical protein